jgi:hypothetical protein
VDDDGEEGGGESGEEGGDGDLEAGRKMRCAQCAESTMLCAGYNTTFQRGVGGAAEE